MVSKGGSMSHIFELFDAKTGNTVGSNSKELRNLYKVWNPQLCSKFFDRESKSNECPTQVTSYSLKPPTNSSSPRMRSKR